MHNKAKLRICIKAVVCVQQKTLHPTHRPAAPNTLNQANSPPIVQYFCQLWDHTAHLTQVHQNTLVVGKC